LSLPILGEKTVRCPTIYGFDLCVNKRSGHHYYYYGYYEPGTIAVMQKSLCPGDVFIDAGASVGQMSFVASDIVGDDGLVLSFEPHKHRYAQLIDGIALNKIVNIRAYNIGLGKEKTVVPLYTDVYSPTMLPVARGSNFQEAKVDTLDAVLMKEHVSEVRMLKIDVEGFEREVLLGSRTLLSSSNAPILSVEYGNSKPHSDAVEFIKEINAYELFQLTETMHHASKLRHIKDTHDLRPSDNIFCFLQKHLKEFPSDMFE
jgi:FkbM family methyltransferase